MKALAKNGEVDLSSPEQMAKFKTAVSKAFDYLGYKEPDWGIVSMMDMAARVNHLDLNYILALDPSKAVLQNASTLLSTLGHEIVHLEGGYVQVHSQAWFDQEIQAHSWEVNNAGFTRVSKGYVAEMQFCISGLKEGAICGYR